MKSKKILAVTAVAAGVLALGASPVLADPGPGGSGPGEAKVCAPGQHANSGQLPEPGFKPPACDPGHGEK